MPAGVVDPCNKKMMDKGKNPQLFTNWSHAWICGYQSHKTKRKFPKIRLVRFLLNDAHMEDEGFTKWIDLPGSRRVEPVRGQGWGVHRQRQRVGNKPRS